MSSVPNLFEPCRHPAAPPTLAEIGALIGDPVRAAMLVCLTDGTQRPAGELARLAGASPQAASHHLKQLVEGGLLGVETLGRHRFYRIVTGDVAELLEGLANWADRRPSVRSHDPALGRARFCYDHLAGRLGVAILDRMAQQGWLGFGADGPFLTAAGSDWCRAQSIDLSVPRSSRRPLFRLCLDWTERRHHLGGHFGAALAHKLLADGCLRRRPGHRTVEVTGHGAVFLRQTFGIDLPG